MKRFFTILFLSVAFISNLNAADTAYPIERTDGMYSLRYLIETEETSLLYFTYTVAEGVELPHLINMRPDTKVISDDVGYRLVQAYNIPLMDEGDEESAYFTYAGQTLDFVLEFERFPLDEPFDLLGFKSVEIDTSRTVTVDSKEFLDSTPYTRYGTYVREGNPTVYFSGEDYQLTLTACDPVHFYGTCFRSGLVTIANSSDRQFKIALSDISAVAHKPVGKRIKNKKAYVLDKDGCNSAWLQIDEASVRDTLDRSAGEVIGGAVSGVGMVSGMDPLAGLGLFAVGALISACDKTDLTPYMKELNEIREKEMKDYLEDRVIEPGESYSSFVTFKCDDDCNSLDICIQLDGKSFNFKW